MKESKILMEWPEHYFVAGLDEVGRGCLAGPVVTAAVILPKGFSSPLLRDSKLLNDKQKKAAYDMILEVAIAYSVQAGSVAEINTLGINKSTFNTMHKCLDELKVKPDHILVDGIVWEQYRDGSISHSTVIKGDDTYSCIAAASIIAKVRRDEYMVKLHDKYPYYGWDSNKGYHSATHKKGLEEKGANRYHRTQYIKNFIK